MSKAQFREEVKQLQAALLVEKEGRLREEVKQLQVASSGGGDKSVVWRQSGADQGCGHGEDPRGSQEGVHRADGLSRAEGAKST
eukprot:2736048-Pyramimonas_sp.AAC.1